LLETYLVEVLGYSWDQVHEEACKMEHVISEEFEKRIAEALGNPARDPHGHCIPSPDLTILKESDEPLSSLRPPAKAFVSRVQDRDSALLRYLKSVGLVPGTEVEAVAYSPFDENLGLRVAGNREPLFLGKAVSSRIHIKSGKAYAKRT
jgi:DtxR family Mn-dependent transcriptional regulator